MFLSNSSLTSAGVAAIGSERAPVILAPAFDAATSDTPRVIVAVNAVPGGGQAATRVKLTRAKPMILAAPDAIIENTAPYCPVSDVAAVHAIAAGIIGSVLPTVLIAARFATNRPTTEPVAHVAVPAPVRVMIPFAGLTVTVMVTAAPVAAWTHLSAKANGVTPGWVGFA